VLSHARRRVLHFQVTEHPTQEWTLQQIREAFPWDQVPRYLLRDRYAIYGTAFAAITKSVGLEEVITAPRSPWQNPYAERLIGSVRRECLDHFIVWNQRSLRRILQRYFACANPFSLGQRCAGAQDRGAAGPGSCARDSSGRRTPSPIPTSRCLVDPKQRRAAGADVWFARLDTASPRSSEPQAASSWLETGCLRDTNSLPWDVLVDWQQKTSTPSKEAGPLPEHTSKVETRTGFSVITGFLLDLKMGSRLSDSSEPGERSAAERCHDNRN
jgi:hypothetical protein